MRGDKGELRGFLWGGKDIKQRAIHHSEKLDKSHSSVSMKSKVFNENTVKLWKSELPEIDSTTKRIDDLVTDSDVDIKNFYCVTFIGYSGLGYESPDLLKETLKSKLEQCLHEHPDKQVVVVCGGTGAGIGAVYSLVREDEFLRDKVKCIGIVSDEALKGAENELALSKDKIAFVPDPDGSWQTKSSSGYPYMLYPSHKYGGEVVSLGGGQIGYDEVKAAQKNGIKTSIFSFRPNYNELQKKLQAGKKFSDLCPVIYHEFGEKNTVENG
ncbi:hypothetical protein DRT92_21955 [Salmonella enterica subsp. enterica serovar Newport]|nr:hypothetical protein [Salmonella enterica subsp. enterica serovar Newport]EBS2390365.1 hypothetical protein [Salmonella enterica subsp. enterica serovar Newport]ECA8782440.1 hypothetical protein [Salmonella enterica subsp. enterica serovar Newport]ECD2006932.1 hypothetical protein [Salmonella enterica subsp. enterica serovar Newport]